MSIHHAPSRWTALLRFCGDGRLEIDNNVAERALRRLLLDEKTICLPALTRGAIPLRQCLVCLGRRSSMDATRKPIFDTCQLALPIILSIASANCRRGTLSDWRFHSIITGGSMGRLLAGTNRINWVPVDSSVLRWRISLTKDCCI